MNDTTNASTLQGRAGRTYLNVVLTANALLLGVLAISAIVPGGFTSVSMAQQGAYAGVSDPGAEDASGRISAAEQRKQMINELKNLSSRMERVEQVLSKGVSVKVTEMPKSFEKAMENRDNGRDSGRDAKEGREPRIERRERTGNDAGAPSKD